MTSALKINQRKGHRIFVTKITLVTADEINEEKLFSFQQLLTEKLQTLIVLDDKNLETFAEEDAIITEINRSSEFRTHIQETIISIKKCLEKKGKRGSRSPSMNANLINSSSNNAKLPKLSI